MAALAATWPGQARGGRMATTFPVDLVEGIRSGDRQAIEQAYDAYFTPVMNFVYFILYDYEAARDISQDAFLRVVEAIKSQKSQVRDFKPYLFATARNLAMDEIKRLSKHTSYSTEMMMAQDPNIFVDPARAASLAEQRAQVANAVATMNEHQRTAMVLRDVEGWSYDEIATFMGMSRNAVGVLLSRARLKFRTEFRLQQLDVDALVDECREMLPLMSAVLDGEATEEEKERLQAHLAACPICRQTMEELAGAATTLRSMVPLAPVLAIKIALIGKTATVVGAAAGAAAAGMSVTAKFFVGVVATLLVAGAGMGTYIVVKKAVSNNPAPTAAVTIPAQGETLTREADAEGKAKVVVLVSVDNKPQKVELAIDGQAVKTFDKGPYRYQWTTDAAGPHTVQPTALDASGKKYPGSKVAFTLAITKSMADKIVFARGGSVWLSNPDGSGQRQLTKSGYDDMPAISPDGTKIAFVSHRDRFIRPDKVRHNYEYLTQIYVMDADGGNVRRLTDASHRRLCDLRVLPDGRPDSLQPPDRFRRGRGHLAAQRGPGRRRSGERYRHAAPGPRFRHLLLPDGQPRRKIRLLRFRRKPGHRRFHPADRCGDRWDRYAYLRGEQRQPGPRVFPALTLGRRRHARHGHGHPGDRCGDPAGPARALRCRRREQTHVPDAGHRHLWRGPDGARLLLQLLDSRRATDNQRTRVLERLRQHRSVR